jgi:hypothetical protein
VEHYKNFSHYFFLLICRGWIIYCFN